MLLLSTLPPPTLRTYLFGILNLDFSRLFSFPFFKIPPFVYCASSMWTNLLPYFCELFSVYCTWQIPSKMGSSRLQLKRFLLSGTAGTHFYFWLEAILCYLLFHLIPIKISRISLCRFSCFIIRIHFPCPDRPGRPLCSSGIWTFHRRMPSLRILAPNMALRRARLPVCCAPAFFP